METKNIQKKFSVIYKVVNFCFYFYLAFLAGIIVTLAIAFTANADKSGQLFDKISHSIQNPLLIAFTLMVVLGILMIFVINVYLLILLRKIIFELKNWNIFTPENAKNIKKLFVICAIIFIVTGLVFSGGILMVLMLLFLWILYEIFFIGFDYKLQNEKLAEENNLTI